MEEVPLPKVRISEQKNKTVRIRVPDSWYDDEQ